MSDTADYPSLSKSDEALLDDLFALLTERVHGNAYLEDGSFSAGINALPVGLRAMAATHYLDVSLALDDIGWHFLNFGEPNLVRETELGLRELGLLDLATWFAEAHQVVRPFLQAFEEEKFSAESGKSRGDIYYEWLDETGNGKKIDGLSKLVWAQEGLGNQLKGSVIYSAWVIYARLRPQNVFTGMRTPIYSVSEEQA